MVDPLAELWINYTLLAVRMADPNGLDDSDLSLLAQPVEDQALVWNLHTDVILAKAVPSEAEVQAAFEAEQPFARVRARHILVGVPRGATRHLPMRRVTTAAPEVQASPSMSRREHYSGSAGLHLSPG